MLRTQVCLTDRQRDELNALANAAKKKKSELIRETVHRLIAQEGHARRDSILRQTAGIWKDLTDLPNFRRLRADWERPS